MPMILPIALIYGDKRYINKKVKVALGYGLRLLSQLREKYVRVLVA
ncbi:hypothetical protein [Streptococcus thoraltensis]|nr:hypothetical protein [Streptococcus thoraltensis]